MTREVLVASILADADGPLRGQQIVARSDGKLGRGTVYVHLETLIERGVVRRLEGNDFPYPNRPLFELNVRKP